MTTIDAYRRATDHEYQHEWEETKQEYIDSHRHDRVERFTEDQLHELAPGLCTDPVLKLVELVGKRKNNNVYEIAQQIGLEFINGAYGVVDEELGDEWDKLRDRGEL